MEIKELPQEYISKGTCHNRYKLPQLFKLANFESGRTCLDYGGGAFDVAIEYLATKGVTAYCYDPYNRTPAHNQEVIDTIFQLRGVDYVCSSNVLNVIKEKEVRLNVIRNMALLGNDDVVCYFLVFEGDRTGIGKKTAKGWQNNMTTKQYLPEIRAFFTDVKRQDYLVTAKGKKLV